MASAVAALHRCMAREWDVHWTWPSVNILIKCQEAMSSVQLGSGDLSAVVPIFTHVPLTGGGGGDTDNQVKSRATF